MKGDREIEEMAERVREAAEKRQDDAEHWEAIDDWDLGEGHYPAGGPITIDHVHHNSWDCMCNSSWLHVNGFRYCEACLPCKDPKAKRR